MLCFEDNLPKRKTTKCNFWPVDLFLPRLSLKQVSNDHFDALSTSRTLRRKSWLRLPFMLIRDVTFKPCKRLRTLNVNKKVVTTLKSLSSSTKFSETSGKEILRKIYYFVSSIATLEQFICSQMCDVFVDQQHLNKILRTLLKGFSRRE